MFIDGTALVLLSNYPQARNSAYRGWLEKAGAPQVHLLYEPLRDPTDYGAIHAAAVRALDFVRVTYGADADLTVHVSPGTPAMQAVWVLLAKTRYPAELIQSHEQTGVRTVSVPFDIAAEYVPALLREADDKLGAPDRRPAARIARARPDRRQEPAHAKGQGTRAPRSAARRDRPHRG